MMIDFMKQQKAELEQAQINAHVAHQYSQRCVSKAQKKTKDFASSPKIITGAFAAGALSGANQSSPNSKISSLLPMLLRFL